MTPARAVPIPRLVRPSALALLPALSLVLGAGCATTPPERLYTLSAGARATGASSDASARDAVVAAASSDAFARSVVVAPAALPELVDRPQLVLRTDADSVVILEQQRWAEPLRTGIARVVADDLGRLLGTWQVSTRDDAIADPVCRVNLDVRAFETPRTGPVLNETLWTVACSGRAPRTGRTATAESITAAPAAATFFPSVVAAHSRAFDTVSRDIATALRELAPDRHRADAMPGL